MPRHHTQPLLVPRLLLTLQLRRRRRYRRCRPRPRPPATLLPRESPRFGWSFLHVSAVRLRPRFTSSPIVREEPFRGGHAAGEHAWVPEENVVGCCVGENRSGLRPGGGMYMRTPQGVFLANGNLIDLRGMIAHSDR